MSASYSNNAADGHARVHYGDHHENVNNTYNSTYSGPPRSRGFFGSWSEARERKKLNPKFLKAIREKQRPRANMLYGQGVDIDYEDHNGYTALHHAARLNYMVEDLLARGYDVNARGRDGKTPLYIAVEASQTEAARKLVAANANVHHRFTYLERSPLHVACTAEDAPEIIQLLLTHRAYVMARDSWLITPLHDAATTGNLTSCRLLLEYGANPKTEDALGETPLHHAATEGAMDVARLLLEHGADFDARDREGRTPLFPAVANQHYSMVSLLIGLGADPKCKDNWGCGAFDGAWDEETRALLDELAVEHNASRPG